MNLTTFNREDGKTVVLVDASLFRGSACLLKMFLIGVLGIRNRLNNNDMEIGSAFHKFRATFRAQGKESFGIAVNEALTYWQNTPMNTKSNKKYLTDAYLIKMCTTYAAKYGNGDDFEVVKTDKDYGNLVAGSCLIEPVTRFMFPYYEDDVCEILVAGTIDELGKFKNGIYAICDCKTTSVWNHDDYFRGYDLSPQLICYRWAWGRYAKTFPDSYFASILATDVGAFIDGVFLAGADKEITLKRSNVFTFSEEQISEFDALVKRKVEDLVSAIHHWRATNRLPLRDGMLTGVCETPYGRCSFFNSCAAKDTMTRELLLQRDFIQHFYDPMEHGK
jgi:hypothetical protein